MSRYPQVKSFAKADDLRHRCAELGVDLPVADVVDPSGPLARPVTIGGARPLTASNRFAALPMEGWDAEPTGAPSDLVRRRWARLGSSGCGLVWGEATAVRPDGRANPRQLVISPTAVDGFAELRALLAPGQVAGLQLTHSGRYSRPAGAPAPRTAYRHPYLDQLAGAAADAVLSDDELDELASDYVAAAVLAEAAGFDFVDVKHCHGYLLHELLSARERPGRYGGDVANRARFLRTVVDGIHRQAPTLAIAVRLSLFDFAPFVPWNGGTGGTPATTDYPYAFGGDGSGTGIDLSEPDALADLFTDLGIGLVSTTAGSPYYNPHVQRPAYFPPSDGYQPPEDPLVGVARQISATAEFASRHPDLTVIGSGYSYLQDWLAHAGQAVVAQGGAAMVGLGRMMLSYPRLAADVLAGHTPDRRLVCRTFSDCTTAPRHGLISGCYPLDEFYKTRPERAELAAAKKATRLRLRRTGEPADLPEEAP